MENVHEIKVEVEKENWSKALDKSFTKNVKKVNVDGFRKGKVPRDVYEKKFGIESLYEDAINEVLPEEYEKVLADNKLEPIIYPKIDVEKISKDSLTLSFKIITKPSVKIKKYTSLGVKKQEVTVTEDEIDNEIEFLREKFADIVIKDGKIENGDTAIIDFEGFKDGVAFDGGKAENYSLEIGSDTFVPGFEEQLIGLKKGDEKDINVTFPEDYSSEELKGKEVTFKIKINEVKTKQLPSIDEDFFADLNYDNVNSEEELRDYIRVQIKVSKEDSIENKYVDDLLEAVLKNTTIDIADELIEDEVNTMLKQYEENMQMQGISMDMYYQFTNSKEEDLKNQMRPAAEKRIKYRFILEEIISLEKIEATDEEAEEEIEKMAKDYNVTKEEILNEVGSIDMIKYDIKMQKALDVLKK